MVGGSGSVGSGGGARGGILLSQLDSDGDLEEGQGSYQAMDGQWNSGASSPKVPAEVGPRGGAAAARPSSFFSCTSATLLLYCLFFFPRSNSALYKMVPKRR